MRQATKKRIDSSALQGDGSYVVLRVANWKAMRTALTEFNAAGGEANTSTSGLVMLNAMLPDMIVEWDWTDEDGKALPLPMNNPDVIDQLTTGEALFLLEKAGELVMADRKNSETPH